MAASIIRAGKWYLAYEAASTVALFGLGLFGLDLHGLI
jgi:hypothetical protein